MYIEWAIWLLASWLFYSLLTVCSTQDIMKTVIVKLRNIRRFLYYLILWFQVWIFPGFFHKVYRLRMCTIMALHNFLSFVVLNNRWILPYMFVSAHKKSLGYSLDIFLLTSSMCSVSDGFSKPIFLIIRSRNVNLIFLIFTISVL